jgi:hypothetical protein
MWIMTAWKCISPELTAKSVRRCCISNAVEGTDDKMLWNDTEEVGNVRREREEDEDTDCEDGEDGDSDTDW